MFEGTDQSGSLHLAASQELTSEVQDLTTRWQLRAKVVSSVTVLKKSGH